MNMKQLRYVLVLAQEGSFSKAADTLGISQPSLSQYIKKIEDEQGVQLFNRSNGDVRITDAGRIFIEGGRKILDIEQQMGHQFEDLSSYRLGSIVVGVTPYRCVHLMPEIVKRFHDIYPGMNLIIEEGVGENLLDDAAHGLFDVCITNLPVDTKIFDYHFMMDEEVLLAVNKNSDLYSKLEKKAVEIENRRYPAVDFMEISGERFAVLGEHQPTQKILDEICSTSGIKIDKAVECRTVETKFAMVSAGIGSALIPSAMAEFSYSENVAFFSFVQQLPYRTMVVVTRKDQYVSKPMKDLIDIMVNLRS